MISSRIVARRRNAGAAAVEFALATMVFFTVLFAIIDFGYLFWVNLTMQHAVREGARLAVVGQHAIGQTIYEAMTARMREQSMGLMDSGSRMSYRISGDYIDDRGVPVALPQNSTGDPKQLIVLHVDCTTQLLTPFIQPFFDKEGYKFRVSAAMRNEAY